MPPWLILWGGFAEIVRSPRFFAVLYASAQRGRLVLTAHSRTAAQKRNRNDFLT